MHTPLPDMRSIRTMVAKHRYRSKLDFKNAYEQVRNLPEDVKHTGMATPLGTFVSLVMQQGDTNAPDTMHRVCYMMFRRYMGRFLDGFYDDWFIYSHTRRAHLRYLRIVLSTLRHYCFLLSKSKVDIFSPSLEVLGAVVTSEGVSVDPAKWSKIQDWPTSRNVKDILRFMGTIQWMADHLPRLSEIAAPITRLAGKVDWNWSPACDFAFATLKSLVPATLKPLDWAKVDAGKERVFLFTDASIFGCGGWLGQGTSVLDAVPFRLHSAKFNSAQRNYSTTDQELLAVLESVIKFREHLIGQRFTVISDHQPLKTYWDQPPKQTRRHVRTWETLAGYDFDWEFIPGKKNVLADALSRLAELEVTQDEVVEPDIADDDHLEFAGPLPQSVVVAMTACRFATSHLSPTLISSLTVPADDLFELQKDPFSAPLSLSEEGRTTLLTQLPSSFINALPLAYDTDPLTRPILKAIGDKHPEDFPAYQLVNGLLFFEDQEGWRLVVPKGQVLDETPEATSPSPSLREVVITYAHEVLGHLGPVITLKFIRRYFFWPHLHRDVFDFCRSCEPCSRGKSSTASPFGLLHPNAIPPRPWAWVSIDFLVSLPPVPYRGEIVDACLTATDMLGKMVHLFPLPSTATALQVAQIYHDGIYRLHGLQEAIISNRDPKFTSSFWRALHLKIGTKLKMSTSAHPEMDGQSEVTNKTVGQILRIFAEDNPDDWPSRTADVEFAINSATSSATGLSPFEVTYGFLPPPFPTSSWPDSQDGTAEEFGERARLNWLRATDALIASRVEMEVQANKHRRRDSPVFSVGQKVYVSTKDLSFPAGTSRKFVPKYIGPYAILSAFPTSSNYEIDLPSHLKVHRRFHASKLRPHFPNDDTRFPSRSFSQPPPLDDVTDGAAQEYAVEKVVGSKMVGKVRWFQVRWLGYSIAEDSWIKESVLRKTAAESIDEYLALLDARAAVAAAATPLRAAPRSRKKKVLSLLSFILPFSQSSSL